MERLTRGDFRALLEFVGGSYAIRDLDAFPAHLISGLPKVVPSDHISYNEMNPRKGRNIGAVEPPDVINFPDGRRIFERHLLEHPLLSHYQRTADGRAFKISDFLPRRQFHRLGLYSEFYRWVRVEYQMGFALPSPPPLVIGIALSRGRRDFSERDRLCLNLLRPHLIQAYRNAEVVTEVQRELTLVRQGVEALGRGLILLSRGGRVRLMTSRAGQWLAEYFGRLSRRADRLPDTLRRWLRHQERLLASQDDVPAPREPLMVEREGKRLVVRLLSDPDEGLLLLEEQSTALQPVALEPLGLTRREAEVLAWVAEGKTNAEIGTILGASPRTVGKHMERIYQKLGVETRTAAALLAASRLRGTELASKASA